MAQRVALGRLRGIKLPPAKPDEPDKYTSVRRTLEFHAESPDGTVLAVPDEIAALILEDKPDSKATLKS